MRWAWAWVNEMKIPQPLVLMATRKLAKGHYRDLEKTHWHGGVTIFKPWTRLTFADTDTGILLQLQPPEEFCKKRCS